MEISITTGGSVLVLIVRQVTRDCDDNIEKLYDLFDDPFYIVETIDCREQEELAAMKNVLLYASEGPYIMGEPSYSWKDIPCLIIKDTSMSTLSTSLMKESVISSLGVGVDLVFLCKWNDSCTMFSSVEGNSRMKYTRNPNSTQAILYSPTSRDSIYRELGIIELDAVIKDKIQGNEMTAITFVPNIVDFDVNMATSIQDYKKLNECSTDPPNDSTLDGSCIAWLTIMFVLLACCCWIALREESGVLL